MRRERGMLSSLTKIKINLIASLLPWHDSHCESSNQKGKLIPQLLIKWYPCTPFDYIREKPLLLGWLGRPHHSVLLVGDGWALRGAESGLNFESLWEPRLRLSLRKLQLLCWSLSKGSSIKTEVCSKLNSPFGSWFYCPQCEVQRNARASQGWRRRKNMRSWLRWMLFCL